MVGGSFCLPQDLFCSTILYSTHFPSSQFVLKTEHFHYFAVENCMQKYSQESFFTSLMWNPNVKEINLAKLVQIIFNTWVGYFGYAGYLLCGKILIILNVSVWSLTLQLVYLKTMEDCSAKNLQHKTVNHFWHIWSVTERSSYTAWIFFALSVVLTFLEIIKHNISKLLLFSHIFNIKMATQKFTNFDKLFNACWYDSCHNTI